MVLTNIKQLCISTGITVAKLEKALRLGNGTIHKWGKSSPGVDKLEKVADYFSVSVDFIIGKSNQSADSGMIAGTFDRLSVEKQSLIKQYISVVERD